MVRKPHRISGARALHFITDRWLKEERITRSSQAVLPDHGNDLFFHTLIPEDAVFQLDVGEQIPAPDQFKILPKGRDPTESALREGLGGIHLPQLLQGVVLDKALGIGGAVQPFIVDDDNLSVLGQVGVELKAVCSGLDSFLEGPAG